MCSTQCSTLASVWTYSPAYACFLSIIMLLYHSEGANIIACFLLHSAKSSEKCESICSCLGYSFLLVFSDSINNTRGTELIGSPQWYESTVGPQCEASSWRKGWKKKKEVSCRLPYRLRYTFWEDAKQEINPVCPHICHEAIKLTCVLENKYRKQLDTVACYFHALW